MKEVLLLLFCQVSITLFGQHASDTLHPKELQEILIKSWMRRDIDRLPDVQNNIITAGKKNELINLNSTNANISIKTGRQVFSKVPGIFVYDMDGSGNQINIATRGLDPHRSWEFNIRQNGVLINSDMYGYPASHYSAPMESFEKIEVIRGTGALQYGAQFGGMVNYVTKKPDSAKSVAIESMNTVGSFGLLSSYNAVEGTIKRFSYYAYYYRRHSKGFRKNSESDADAQFIQLLYQVSDKIALKAEMGRSKYLFRIPGPLNDSMFYANARMSTRSRNYFSPDIYIPSFNLAWRITNNTNLNLTASGVFGNRSSVQFDAFANMRDAIDPATNTFKNRQVDIDRFNSRIIESRLLHQYNFGRVKNKLAAGVVYMNNDLHRRQLGKGTTGSEYDLALVTPGFGRDIHFLSNNIAVFAENAFIINGKWTISPGIRWENGQSNMKGIINYYPANQLPTAINHQFVLSGISTQYVINNENNFYGGFSQAYRPVIFKDIVPASTYEQVDKKLKDASGYNLEAGARGKLAKHIQYDITFFSLLYNNRMGTLVLQDNSGQPYTYRTNIGNSRTNGLELFLQYKFPLTNHLYAGLFTSTSYMKGKYINGEVSNGTTNKSIKGNKIEAVPDWISRNGLDILYKGLSCTFLYSYTSSSFSDALNTVIPPATGARGFTPSYAIWDFNFSFKSDSFYSIRAGVNNILDKQYFTKRPTFYPGPGIWPSDGRNVYMTLGIRL